MEVEAVVGDVEMQDDTPDDPDAGGTVIGGKVTLPWVEKYRPENVTDLVAHKDIISTIDSFAKKNQLPNLLLHGPPGTGKTSTIMAVAREMYGKRKGAMVLELNASDSRGIDVVRDQIKAFVSSKGLFAGKQPKLVVLDEADNMTKSAQFAMRRIMEQYLSNARFCMICNFPSKIIPALQSRCTKFRFPPLTLEEAKPRILEIVGLEKLKIGDDAIATLFKCSGGDMRKVLNVLQSSAMHVESSEGVAEITSDVILNQVGRPLKKHVERMMELLTDPNGDVKDHMREIDTLCTNHGYALTDIIVAVHEAVHKRPSEQAKIAQLAADLADLEHRLNGGGNERVHLFALVGSFNRCFGA